jgi:hypothetical protein
VVGNFGQGNEKTPLSWRGSWLDRIDGFGGLGQESEPVQPARGAESVDESPGESGQDGGENGGSQDRDGGHSNQCAFHGGSPFCCHYIYGLLVNQ